MASVSIGALRYDILADTQKFSKGVITTQREMRSLRKTFGASQLEVAGYTKQMANLDKMNARGNISTQTYDRHVRRLNKSQNEHLNTLRKLKVEVDRYAESERRAADASQRRMSGYAKQKAGSGGMGAAALGRFGGGAAVGFAAAQGVRASIGSFMELEQAQADFGVLTGSVQDGNAAVERFRELAAQTPMSFSQISKGARTMLSFGVESNKVDGALRQLMDVAGGNAERFQSLALVYGQVASNTKLMGQDLLQFINAGFNPLLEISQATGKSMTELRDEMSKGKITFDQVAQAIASATGEAGRFNNRMNEFAKTTPGQLALTQAKFKDLGTEIGRAIRPLTSLTLFLGGKFADGWGSILGLAGDTVDAIDRVSKGGTGRAMENSRAAEAAEKEAAAAKEMAEQEKIRADARRRLASETRREAEQREKNKSAIDQINALRERNLVLTQGADAAARIKLEREGASKELIEELRLLQERNEKLNRSKQLEQQRTQSIKSARQAEIARLKQRRDQIQNDRDKPIKVEVARGAGALRGSRDEFQILRELQTARQNEEQKRHMEAQRERETSNELLRTLNERIERLESGQVG